MDLSLIFATPLILPKEQEISIEQVEELCERCKLTDDFLKGRVSAADFLDYMNDDYQVNTTEYLDSVESNFNHIVDIHGRPIY